MVSWLFLLLSLPSLLFLSFDSKKKFAPRSAPSRQKTFVRVATDQNETGRIEKNNEKQQLCKKPLLTAISFFLICSSCSSADEFAACRKKIFCLLHADYWTSFH